ncbi:MAG: hypothetical protein Fur005_14770 [Roseiflexaceae bacterium]
MTSKPSPQELPPCDLVMKGGATSGVVYPPVIAELAKKYRFANIGGTSAGAIASAVTAAAEYGRQRGHLRDFAPLNDLSTELSKPGQLLNLFRNSAPNHLLPLLDTLLPLVSDPTAATTTSNTSSGPSGVDLPRLANTVAPELISLLFPPKPVGKEVPDQHFNQSIQKMLTDLPITMGETYEQGAVAGAQVGSRLGKYLIYATAILSVIFGIPLLVAGITLASGLLWVAFSLMLISGALWASNQIGNATVQASGTTVAMAGLARLLLEELPHNLYGICTGHRQPETPANQPALTDWLSGWIDRMAGPTDHGGPLTFADLRECFIGVDTPGNRKTVAINLQMVTTNLSHARPYILPLSTDMVLLFRRGDMDALFPEAVVEYMCLDRHLYPGWSLEGLNAGLPLNHPDRMYMLPLGDDLPVIVGMRMSLSFPILISAVRLFTISGSCTPDTNGEYRPLREHLQENWFSDGGICSNFPIHFFDSWLPTHPTFGINLTSLPRDAFSSVERIRRGVLSAEQATTPGLYTPIQPGYVSQIAPEAPASPIHQAPGSFLKGALLGIEDQAPPENSTTSTISASNTARVVLPSAEQPMSPLWRPVESVTRFLWSMFDTAMNYRDTAQLMLPSYKERAVQIRLDGTREGGLNLNMPEDIVANLQRYGREAGVVLRDQFDFDRHRWVRFLVLMNELERQILSLEEPLGTLGRSQTIYEELIKRADLPSFPYGSIATPTWVAAADTRLRALRALVATWREANEEEDLTGSDRRIDDLSQALLALSQAWQRGDITPEESERRAQAVLALVESWGGSEYIGREGQARRFFRPVAASGVELRVTPDL